MTRLAVLAALACAACSAPGNTSTPPACASSEGGFVAALEVSHTPGTLTTELVERADVAAMPSGLAVEVRGAPEVRDGVVTLRAALVNRSATSQHVDVLSGGVAGLSSNPLSLRPIPEPPWRAGLDPSTFTAPEVYPAPSRWTLAPGAEVLLTARYCLARHDAPTGATVHFQHAFEVWEGPKPQGGFDVVAP